MQCKNCAADFPSDQLKCPYCGTINEHALKLAKELQVYDEEYKKSRDEMLATGENLVLRKITMGLGFTFLTIVLVFVAYIIFSYYRFNSNSGYQTSGPRYTHNKKLVEKYIEEGNYLRAYTLASATDPTTEYFENYPEHKDELTAIYDYSLILYEIERAMTDMDEGNNYRSLTPNLVISYSIFYSAPDSDVKAELEEELDMYLRNLYCLTDDEIKELKTVVTSTDFMLDGETDYETVSKERMVKRFGR